MAKFLYSRGHQVSVYSRHIGGILTAQLRRQGIPVYDDLVRLSRNKFDIMHVSHNVMAYGTRYVFQHVPMIFLSHGVLPFLEQPPICRLNISKFLAVSEEVRENLLEHRIPRRKIMIFRNIVDTDRFAPTEPLNQKPKRSLIFGRKFDLQTKRIIVESCRSEGIEVNEIDDDVFDVENYINRADIVFTRGRGAIEAMSCGRIVVVPGEGVVTYGNLKEVQKCNFSGRRFHRPFTRRNVRKAILHYDPVLGDVNRRITLEHFSADRKVDAIVQCYRDSVKDYKEEALDVEAISILARPWCELDEIRVQLEDMKQSAGYKFVKFYSVRLDQLFPNGTLRGRLRSGIVAHLQDAMTDS